MWTHVTLSADLLTFFRRATHRGQGGFQSLGRTLARRLETTDTLRLTPAEMKRIARYASFYGNGGYQQRFLQLLREWAEQNMTSPRRTVFQPEAGESASV